MSEQIRQNFGYSNNADVMCKEDALSVTCVGGDAEKYAFAVQCTDYQTVTNSLSTSLQGRICPDLPNHQLHTVAAHCGFDLTQHHHSLADAEACAAIELKVF
jgi:hypothetical protein